LIIPWFAVGRDNPDRRMEVRPQPPSEDTGTACRFEDRPWRIVGDAASEVSAVRLEQRRSQMAIVNFGHRRRERVVGFLHVLALYSLAASEPWVPCPPAAAGLGVPADCMGTDGTLVSSRDRSVIWRITTK
jgi:hypothetical protein